MGEIAEKIMVENDLFALKRDYKYALEKLTAVKKETAEIITEKEKITKELDEAKDQLQVVKNQISEEKLSWASHRHAELEEIEQKKAEADNIIKRKSELNEQEETIRQIEAKNTEVLNETRRMELKLKEDKAELEAKEKELESERKKHKKDIEKLTDDKKSFKNKVLSVLKEVEKI